MRAFIIITPEKDFIVFAENEEKAVEEFRLKRKIRVLRVEECNYDEIYELD